MVHLEEETIAQHAAGLLTGEDLSAADVHLATCPVCRATSGGYRSLVGSLSAPSVPADVLARVQDQVRQRVRVKTFIQQLIEDPSWRTEVGRDPRAALERHRIRPTPQLLAALKEISTLQEGVDGSQLDERISKLLPPI
ncbi:MAG TPA: hypothetical protein VI007_08185 [bacterium]